MNVFILDADRCGVDHALRCAAHGHSVRLFRPPGLMVKDGNGFPSITITSDLKSSLKWAKEGIVFTTANCRYLDELDRWRQHGYPIFGPTKASAKLEIDRALGMRVMKDHGLDIAPYHEFSSLSEALKFAWKATEPFVFKPIGDTDDKALTFVSNDPGQLVGWIEKKIKSGMKLKGKCILQSKIDMVAEVGIAGFLGSHGFLEDKYEESFEFKKLMPGDFGPSTGEQGTVIKLTKQSKLTDILKSFESHFRALGHTGDVAINGGVDSKGRYMPFEFTCRAGWPDQYIRFSLHQGDPAQWAKDALDGKDTLKVSYDVAIGVVVAQRPYPYGDGTPSEVEGNPIYGVDEVADHVHFAQVSMSKGPVWNGSKTVEQMIPVTSGPYVLICTGHGKTVKEAQESVYGVVDQIALADAIVRNDVGDKLEKQLPILHKLGYCEEMEFGNKKG